MFRIKSWMIMAGLAGLFALISYIFFGWPVALLVLGVTIVVTCFSSGYSVSIILKIHRARLLSPWELPDLQAIAERLAQNAGISMPVLAYYQSDMPNAFALDGRPGNQVVAVSSSLFQSLDRRELTGVLAHEFAYLKNKDSRINLSAGMFVQTILTMTTFINIILIYMLLTGAWTLSLFQIVFVLGFVGLAPYATSALHAALSREREWLADYESARLTGDPRGLASALH